MTRKKNQTIASLAYQERSAKRLALTNLAKINSLEDNKMAANLQPEPVTPRAFPWRTLIAVLVCFGLIALAILAPTLGWVSACSGWLVASYWVGMIILIILIPLWILLASRFGWFWLVALLALALVLFGAFGGSWFSLCATTGTSPDNNTSDLPSGGSTTNESCGVGLAVDQNAISKIFPSGNTIEPLYEDGRCPKRITAYVVHYMGSVATFQASSLPTPLDRADWWDSKNAHYGDTGFISGAYDQVTLRPASVP